MKQLYLIKCYGDKSYVIDRVDLGNKAIIYKNQFYLMSTQNVVEQLPPQQVVREAKKFSQTMGRFTQLPKSSPKRTYIRYLAEDKNNDIGYTIDRNYYQHQVFHNLEEADQHQRNKFQNIIASKQQKIDNNQVELEKKRQKQVEAFEKHLAETYKKHVQIQRNKKHDKDDEAIKLRKQLQEFYEKQKQRKSVRDHRQVKVSTCYQDAVRRIDQIHKKNELYALKSERQYEERMKRNDGKQRNLLYMTRMKSLDNKKKQDVYVQNEEIMNENEMKFIQTYCKDLDISLKAFDHKEKESGKTKERLHKFFKDRVEKWHGLKHRVDEQKAQVPRKCLNILDKTTKASFRHTFSSFKDSGKEWYNRVQQNKTTIWDTNEQKKDRIMEEHLDRRNRNHSQFIVNQRMGSMRDRAKKLSSATSPIKSAMSTGYGAF